MEITLKSNFFSPPLSFFFFPLFFFFFFPPPPPPSLASRPSPPPLGHSQILLERQSIYSPGSSPYNMLPVFFFSSLPPPPFSSPPLSPRQVTASASHALWKLTGYTDGRTQTETSSLFFPSFFFSLPSISRATCGKKRTELASSPNRSGPAPPFFFPLPPLPLFFFFFFFFPFFSSSLCYGVQLLPRREGVERKRDKGEILEGRNAFFFFPPFPPSLFFFLFLPLSLLQSHERQRKNKRVHKKKRFKEFPYPFFSSPSFPPPPFPVLRIRLPFHPRTGKIVVQEA